MHWIYLVALLLLPSITAAQDAQATLQAVSKGFEALSETVSPAVVQVVASGYAPAAEPGLQTVSVARQRRGGSGVIVDPARYVVTNAHVVEGAIRLQILLAAGSPLPFEARSAIRPPAPFRDARLVGIDLETDLAVLKIEGLDLPVAFWGFRRVAARTIGVRLRQPAWLGEYSHDGRG